MAPRAPLRVTVRIELSSGAAAGQRRHRLCSAVGLPAELWLPGVLPLDEGDGEGDGAGAGDDAAGRGQVSFVLPGGQRISASARLRADASMVPTGTRITLSDLGDVERLALERYVTERTES